jgi:hypothetical protein
MLQVGATGINQSTYTENRQENVAVFSYEKETKTVRKFGKLQETIGPFYNYKI